MDTVNILLGKNFAFIQHFAGCKESQGEESWLSDNDYVPY